MRNKYSSELHEFASEKFSFLLSLGFNKSLENGGVFFFSNWLKLCLITERFEVCPQDITFFLPEEMETPSLYIALQYYMDDYWGEWRKAWESSKEIDENRRRIDAACKILASNSWLLTNQVWLKNVDFSNACFQLKKWFQIRLSEGNLPSAEEATMYLRSLNKKFSPG